MRKEFEFKFSEGKFLVTKNESSQEECYSIDVENLQFDIRKFYEAMFLDINEHIDIQIVNKCIFPENCDPSIQKKAKHVYDTINNITLEICLKLNKQCFTSETVE